jgi:hypothetical protein
MKPINLTNINLFKNRKNPSFNNILSYERYGSNGLYISEAFWSISVNNYYNVIHYHDILHNYVTEGIHLKYE